MAKDPICDMEVNEDSPAATYEYKGKTYYFCAKGCQERFSQDPDKYIKEE
ncbi:MAG: YHS domain-containing protein [Thermodesulfobacteriota bacterium]